MYDTMAHPPRPGSLLEMVFTMIQMRRDSARIMETLAIIQAVRDDSESGENTQKAFQEYQDFMLPHSVANERDTSVNIQRALADEFRRGPMAIKSVESSRRVRSHLRKTIDELRQVSKPTLRWKRK